MKKEHFFSLGEEIANSITHGIGALLAVAALTLLIIAAGARGTSLHMTSFAIFGISLVLLYLASTLYHGIQHSKAKHIFKTFDHSAIYLLIAGTYTPFALVILRGPARWWIMGAVWGLAALGIIVAALWVDRFRVLSTFCYIAMGWIFIFAWKPLFSGLPQAGIAFLVVGGVLYTAGTVFYLWRGFRFHHAVWHLFVLAGSVAHFFCVFKYV